MALKNKNVNFWSLDIESFLFAVYTVCLKWAGMTQQKCEAGFSFRNIHPMWKTACPSLKKRHKWFKSYSQNKPPVSTTNWWIITKSATACIENCPSSVWNSCGCRINDLDWMICWLLCGVWYWIRFCFLIFDVWFLIFDFWFLIFDFWFLIFDFWFLIIDFWFLIIDYWLLIFYYWFLIFDFWFLIFYYWFLIFDFWFLIFDFWFLIFDFWFLIFNFWFLIFDFWFLIFDFFNL